MSAVRNLQTNSISPLKSAIWVNATGYGWIGVMQSAEFYKDHYRVKVLKKEMKDLQEEIQRFEEERKEIEEENKRFEEERKREQLIAKFRLEEAQKQYQMERKNREDRCYYCI